jgi:hypothetical protein
MRIDLVIAADRLAPDAAAQSGAARLPLLEKLLARGEPWELDDAPDLKSCLRTLFRVPDDPLPIAALGLLGEGMEPGSHNWLRLDPIHLRAEHSRLRLVALPDDCLGQEAAQALIAALAPHLAAENAELIAVRPQQWYLRSPRPLPAPTGCPRRCAGVLDEHALPAGEHGAYWRRLITEAQMLLHELPLNEQREAQGKLAINGVWPWGSGAKPSIAAAGYQHVYADDAWVRGLGRAGGAEPLRLPADAGAIAGARADVLFVLKTAPARSLQRIEQTWLEPLAAALERAQASELRLALVARGRTIACRLTRRHMHRWWRRRRPLPLHA